MSSLDDDGVREVVMKWCMEARTHVHSALDITSTSQSVVVPGPCPAPPPHPMHLYPIQTVHIEDAPLKESEHVHMAQSYIREASDPGSRPGGYMRHSEMVALLFSTPLQVNSSTSRNRSVATSRASSAARGPSSEPSNEIDMAKLARMMGECTSMEDLNALKMKLAAPPSEKPDERTVCTQNHDASMEVAKALKSHEALVAELPQCSEYSENITEEYKQDKDNLKDQYYKHRDQLDLEFGEKVKEAQVWEDETKAKLLVAQADLDRAHKQVYELYAQGRGDGSDRDKDKKEDMQVDAGAGERSSPIHSPADSDSEWTKLQQQKHEQEQALLLEGGSMTVEPAAPKGNKIGSGSGGKGKSSRSPSHTAPPGVKKKDKTRNRQEKDDKSGSEADSNDEDKERGGKGRVEDVIFIESWSLSSEPSSCRELSHPACSLTPTIWLHLSTS